MTQALQTAWNDSYVVNNVWDSSLSYVDSTWQYSIPSTVTVVRDLYFLNDTSSNPRKISTNCYDVVAGKIQFNNKIRQYLSTGMAIYIRGSYKLASTDSLTTNNLVNYVINLAAELLLNNLVLKRSFVFLKNDTTMTDIVRSLQVIQGNVLRYKQAITRTFESS